MEVGFYGRLLRSVLGVPTVRVLPMRLALAFPGAILTAVLLFTAFGAPGALGSISVFRHHEAPDELMKRAAEVKAALSSVSDVVESEVDPLARIITTYRNDERLARRVATALVREGHRAGLSPEILLAVMLVENPWINPGARSPVGARGLMQVMPGHRGQWKACPVSLDEIESNICYGAQIFKSYLMEEHGQVERALLRYNGCVNGTNTPNCAEYPSAVFARISKSSGQRVQHTHAAD